MYIIYYYFSLSLSIPLSLSLSKNRQNTFNVSSMYYIYIYIIIHIYTYIYIHGHKRCFPKWRSMMGQSAFWIGIDGCDHPVSEFCHRPAQVEPNARGAQSETQVSGQWILVRLDDMGMIPYLDIFGHIWGIHIHYIAVLGFTRVWGFWTHTHILKIVVDKR